MRLDWVDNRSLFRAEQIFTGGDDWGAAEYNLARRRFSSFNGSHRFSPSFEIELFAINLRSYTNNQYDWIAATDRYDRAIWFVHRGALFG